MTQEEERAKLRETGFRFLAALDEMSARKVQDNLRTLAPELGDFIVEFAYGTVISRPGLDLPTRQVATVAALAALGNAPDQLKFHLGGTLNVGVTPRQIVEIMYLVTVFCGFPAGLNGLAAAQAVFEQRGLAVELVPAPQGARRERGLAALEATSGPAGEEVLNSLAEIAPALADFILEFSYGDVISRPHLPPAWKETVMIAAAAARGGMTPQLKVHLKAALAVGMTQEELLEVMNQLAIYAGFPSALNGVAALQEVVTD
ncbi:MAG: carboxymuconolactone decarboxylase family protein [Deltaproteobacteria bacterium]|nr:carboxymuconolactone decarboxylase family protein [Deltaproteobacteria bacterium]